MWPAAYAPLFIRDNLLLKWFVLLIHWRLFSVEMECVMEYNCSKKK